MMMTTTRTTITTTTGPPTGLTISIRCKRSRKWNAGVVSAVSAALPRLTREETMRRAILGLLAAALMVGGAVAARSDTPEPVDKNARPLFNGRDLTGWKLRHEGGKNGW